MSGFKVSLGYKRPCFKNQKGEKKEVFKHQLGVVVYACQRPYLQGKTSSQKQSKAEQTLNKSQEFSQAWWHTSVPQHSGS